MSKRDYSLSVNIIFDSQGAQETDPWVKELINNMQYVRNLKGWSHKRVYLTGFVTLLGSENPDLTMQIVDYLTGEYKGKKE